MHTRTLYTWHLLFALLLGILTGCQSIPPQTVPLRLHGLFGDHMVLPRHKPFPVWGTATPGSQVTVTLANESHSARTDETGEWRISFEPREAGGPFQLTVDHYDSLYVLHDVMVGDVWLCGGQSNMEWSLERLELTDTSLTGPHLSDLRVFTVTKMPAFTSKHMLSTEPDTNHFEQQWLRATSDSIRHFSAVGYYFGREIKREVGVPIGLISSNWAVLKLRHGLPWRQ